MKRHWIEFVEKRPTCPMTWWVHRPVSESPAVASPECDPPRQAVVPGKGYPLFYVEVNDFTFEFSSLAELDQLITVFSEKLLPRTLDLSRQRHEAAGPNRHWLSRLPKDVKSWKYREKAVVYLCKARDDFSRALQKG